MKPPVSRSSLRARFSSARVSDKIALIIIAVLVGAMLIIFAANAWLTIRQSLRDARESLQTLTDAAGQNLQGPLAFKDKRGAHEVLQSLRASSRIVRAEVRNTSNDILAEYSPERPQTFAGDFIRMLPVPQEQVISRPLAVGGEALGTLTVQASLNSVWQSQLNVLLWMAAVAGMAFLTAILLARRLSMMVVEPIEQIASTARRITRGSDYTLRVSKVSDDEVGVLADEFNNMLNMITERDIEMLATQHQLQATLAAIPDLLFELGLDGRYHDYHSAGNDLLAAPPEVFLGHTVPEILPADAAAVVMSALMEANESGASRGRQFALPLPQGIRWFELSVARKPAKPGTEPRFIVLSRDITERKQAEAARESLEVQLRESQKMEAIGTLAGGIAHDFNNILATILGNTELAHQDLSANPLALQSLEEIRKAATRARDLVQQILSFSRRQPTARQPVALGPIVGEAARLLRATLPARLVLEVNCDAAAPPVLADATQIQQVLINLGTNAMQAIRSGPGRIGITLDMVPLDADLAAAHPVLRAMRDRPPVRVVRLVVSDDGPGMDTATLERIFEPFFTTKVVGEGTGLGLSVVHGIVQAHGGAIEVDSQPGKGSTFTLYLPAAEARTDAPARDAGTAAPTPALRVNGGQHILYVDDDESLVFLIQRLLERRGYRVSAYTDQNEALAALRADPAGFDLVLTDYNMPGLSGLDVARAVREIRADLPVAVVSGFIDETLQAGAAGAGVRELIFKASAVKDLCESITRVAQTIGESRIPSDRIQLR